MTACRDERSHAVWPTEPLPPTTYAASGETATRYAAHGNSTKVVVLPWSIQARRAWRSLPPIMSRPSNAASLTAQRSSVASQAPASAVVGTSIIAIATFRARWS